MRSLRKSWIGIVLILLFGISLFFWRQSSYVSNIFNSDNVIAKVGSTPISTTRFNRALQMNIQQFNQILGKDLSSEQIKNFQIPQLALRAIINETVFENEFNELNFNLDETIIAKKTKEAVPLLYNKNNELDEDYLKQFLSQQNLKVEDVVQIFHYDARNDYFNSTFLDIDFPSSFANKIESYNRHIRDIEYLKIPIKLIDITEILKDSEVMLDNLLFEYYEKNIQQYKTDEKRDIEYILIDKKDFINRFSPVENEILEYYNNNSDLYFKNEKRNFIQFNNKTSSQAEELKKLIEKIPTYEEVISYANKKNIKYNVFDNLGRDEVLEEIAQPLFSLNINEQSSIIKTPLAYHIIILKSIEPERQLSFNEVKDDIINTILSNDLNNFLIDLENTISQDILDGFSLKEIAKKNELRLSSLKNITLNFDEFDKKDELFFNSIIDHALSANLNFINDIVKLNQDKLYTYEIVKITESEPLNFTDIKDKIFDDWKKFKQVEKIELTIKNNNKNYNFLKDLEKEFEIKIENFSITESSNTSIPRELAEDIFNSDLDNIAYKVYENEIHLSKLIKINLEEKSDKIEKKISLLNEIRNTLYNELLKKTKISTNDQLLDSILNNY